VQWFAAVFTISLSLAWGQQAEVKTGDCAKLASLSLPGTKVVSSELVAAGAFTPPGQEQPSANGKALFSWTPAFWPCGADGQAQRRLGDSDRSVDAGEGMEWAVSRPGNGGFAGSTDYMGWRLR